MGEDVNKLKRAVCEICGLCDGPFHPDFDGYACEECQAQWTERATDDQRQELDEVRPETKALYEAEVRKRMEAPFYMSPEQAEMLVAVLMSPAP